MLRVAAGAIRRRGIAFEAAADDAFASQTGNVCNSRDCCAVPTNGGGLCEGQYAATTYKQKETGACQFFST